MVILAQTVQSDDGMANSRRRGSSSRFLAKRLLNLDMYIFVSYNCLSHNATRYVGRYRVRSVKYVRYLKFTITFGILFKYCVAILRAAASTAGDLCSNPPLFRASAPDAGVRGPPDSADPRALHQLPLWGITDRMRLAR